MRMRTFGLVVVCVPLLLCVTARGARACSCAEYAVREKFRSADAVFVGRVAELTPTEPTKKLPLAQYVVRFEVERRWKGARGREVTAVAMFDIPGMCGDLKLEVGERYLIYAPREDGRFVIYGDCGPNRDLRWSETAEEVRQLDSFWLRAKARLYPYPKLF